MPRTSSAEAAALARQRLARLGRELGRDHLGDDGEHAPVPLVVPGRHARQRSDPLRDRFADWLARRRVALAASVSLRGSHLTVLLVVATVALSATAWWTLHGTSSAVPLAPRTTDLGASISPRSGSLASPALAVSPSSSAAPTSRSTPSAGAVVVVDIAGKVRRPGVATLPAGSRVIDALRHAGGTRRGVDLSSLNLARVLVDGEQILVGGPVSGPVSGTVGGPGALSTDPPSSSTATTGTPAGAGAAVNINSAGPETLDLLPGVGPVTAQKIVSWRTAHGSFTTIDELLEVDGIGPKTLAELAPHATL
jgi:competence protein ComEA